MAGGERIDFDDLREQVLRAIREGNDAAMRDLARLAIAAFGRRGQGSGRARRRRAADPALARAALGARPARSARIRPSARPEPLTRDQIRRFEQHLRRELERDADRAHAGAAALAAAERARPRAAVGAAAGPRRGAPRRDAAQAPARHPGPRDARAQAPRPRRRAPHDARLAADRRRARGAALQAPAPAPARALRALRRVDERHVGLRVLPQRAARAARLVPQDALVRVRRADLRGHRRLRARALLQGGLATRSPRTRAWPTSRATRTTGASGASSWRSVEDDLHPRATVIVLGDARTNGRDPAAHLFAARRRARRAHVLAQPRAAAVLELRRLGDRRLRAVLRGLRVLDDAPARGLREGAHASGCAPDAVGLHGLGDALQALRAGAGPRVAVAVGGVAHLLGRQHGAGPRARGQAAGEVDGRAEPVAPAVDGRAVGDAGAQRREAPRAPRRARPARASWPPSARARARRASPRRRSPSRAARAARRPRPPAVESCAATLAELLDARRSRPSSVKPTRSANATRLRAPLAEVAGRQLLERDGVRAQHLPAGAARTRTPATAPLSGSSDSAAAAKRRPSSCSSAPPARAASSATERADRLGVARHPAAQHPRRLEHALVVEAGLAQPVAELRRLEVLLAEHLRVRRRHRQPERPPGRLQVVEVEPGLLGDLALRCSAARSRAAARRAAAPAAARRRPA